MPDTEDNQTEHDHREDEEAANPTGDRDVDPKLLEILVCPLTKAPLRYDRRARELISDQAGLAFPIRNGVPIMLVDEARALDDDPVSPGIVAMAERNNGSVPK
jgi:uncharacterized protein YbaR (Trm112 family)